MLASSPGIISDSALMKSGTSWVGVGPTKRSQIVPEDATFVIPQLGSSPLTRTISPYLTLQSERQAGRPTLIRRCASRRTREYEDCENESRTNARALTRVARTRRASA